NATRGPLLLTAGGQDRTAPKAIVTQTAKRYAGSAAVTDVRDFADRGHSLTIDSGWREVADTALDFVKRFLPAKTEPAAPAAQ
ncbi:MAG: hypothetical protein QOI84_452, partial [Solirubrobacterales bacterium]|nr:hypothetical protein [Solirubrobacterales bacterium]